MICAALLMLGPRRPFLTWQALAGGMLAVLGALPYLAWQAVHGWPQSAVAASIAGEDNRIAVIPIQLVLVTGGKGYYAAGLLPVIVAAAGISTDNWLARGRRWLRTALVSAALGVSLVLNAINGLPITPVADLEQSGINELNPEAGEQVGWPEFRDAVRAAMRTLAPDQQGRAVVFTSNYGEASAVRLGRRLPPAYSGHNGYAFWPPPPASAAGPVILTGFAPGDPTNRHFTGCRVAGRVDNGYGLNNDEQGAILQVCTGPAGTWAAVWPALIHYD